MGAIRKTFKKIVRVTTGGLIGGHSNSGQETPEEAAPELGFVNTDTTNTTESESESEKQQLTKGKKRGKKSLKVNMTGAGGTGRNIV